MSHRSRQRRLSYCRGSRRAHAHARVHASGDDAPRRPLHVVTRDGEGGDAIRVGVADHEQQRARLRREGANLSVAPARDDGSAVVRDADAEALEVHHLNAQQLQLLLCPPDANVGHAACDEEVAAVPGEDHVVHAAVVARSLQLRVQLRREHVLIRLIRAGVEAAPVGLGDNGRDRTEQGRLQAPDFVHRRVDVNDRAISAADQVVDVAARRVDRAADALDAAHHLLLAEELQTGRDGVRLVAGLSAAQGELVVGSDGDGLDDPPQGAHLRIHRMHLGEGDVDLPHPEVEVPGRDEAIVAAVQPLERQGGVAGRRTAADGTARLHVPHDERVVVLGTEGSQVARVAAKVHRNDASRVLPQSEEHRIADRFARVAALHGFLQIPDDHIRLHSHVLSIEEDKTDRERERERERDAEMRVENHIAGGPRSTTNSPDADQRRSWSRPD
eukprot:scaffold565_cov379-Pinguiococcus_pyrenoidosus.AAC.10